MQELRGTVQGRTGKNEETCPIAAWFGLSRGRSRTCPIFVGRRKRRNRQQHMKKQKLAIVDLTTGKIEKKTSPQACAENTLEAGHRHVHALQPYQPGCDPLGPDNLLAISAGLLGGTTAPSSSRTHLASKSPLTGLIAGSSMGGFFGPELRFTGFDHLLFKGKAAKPVYLWIHDGEMEIRDASAIWGRIPLLLRN